MIPSWILWAGGVVVGICLLPYVLGPVLIFFATRFRMPPTILEIDPRTHSLPNSARVYFGEAHQALTAEGFELTGTMGLPDLVPNAQALFALYINRVTSDMAMSTIIVAQSELAPTMRTNYVEFIRRFDDGMVVQTNNSSELNAFKTLPNEITTKFWEIKDIRRLFRIHTRSVDHFRQGGRPVNRLDAEFRGNAIQFVTKAVLEEPFREQLGTGYLSETATGFRPTVKGALIMTWQELWPAKAIRKARERKRAEKLLAELGPQATAVY